MKMEKWIKILGAALVLLLALIPAGGCGKEQAEEPPPEEEPVEEIVDVRTHVNGALTLDDGRKVDGFAYGKIGDELTNVFFTFCVNKAELRDEFGEDQAERGFAYLVAEVTVSNAFDGPIPMWASDFIAQWGEGDGDYCYPLAKTAGTQMEEEFRLAVDQSVTRELVFEVPLPEVKNEYGISYLEYYEDDVEGNLFMVSFELSAPQKASAEEDGGNE
ncbi:MAG: DUF4352 domain-containing protein [Clostridiales bacterium]|nr:DUF4352 domain-containing protein [Clostridiales bacterium]